MSAIKLEIEAHDINAKNCYAIYGLPSPFTFKGFLDSLAFATNISNIKDFVLIIHDFEPKKIYNAYTQIKSTQRDAKGSTQMDIPRANIRFSIIFEIDEVDKDDIEDFLSKARFSGGKISHKKTAMDFGDKQELLIKSKKGFVVKEKEFIKNNNAVDDYLEQIEVAKGKKGFVSPSMMGYKFINKPTEIKKARGGKKHVFAEPILGLIYFEAIRKFGDRQTQYEDCVWGVKESEDKILITNKG